MLQSTMIIGLGGKTADIKTGEFAQNIINKNPGQASFLTYPSLGLESNWSTGTSGGVITASSPAAPLAAVASGSGTVNIFNDTVLENSFFIGDAQITSLSFNKDSTLLLAGKQSGRVAVYSTVSGGLVREILISGTQITALCPSFDNTIFYAGDSAGIIYEADAISGNVIISSPVSAGAVTDIAISASGQTVCAGDSNGYIMMVRPHGLAVYATKEYSGEILGIAPSTVSDIFYVLAKDSTSIEMLDDTGSATGLLDWDSEIFTSVCSYDSAITVSGTGGDIFTWESGTLNRQNRITLGEPADSIEYMGSKARVVAARDSGSIEIINPTIGPSLGTIDQPAGASQAVKIHPLVGDVISSGSISDIYQSDLTAQVPATVTSAGTKTSIALLANQSMMLATAGGEILEYDAGNMTITRQSTLIASALGCMDMDLSSASNLGAAGADDGTMVVFNLTTLGIETAYSGHAGSVRHVSFYNNSNSLESIGWDGYLRSWNTTTWAGESSLWLGSDPVISASLDRSTSMLAFSQGNTITIIDMSTSIVVLQQSISSFTSVKALTWNNNTGRLLAADSAGDIAEIDPYSGVTAIIDTSFTGVGAMDYSATDDVIAVGTLDGDIHLLGYTGNLLLTTYAAPHAQIYRLLTSELDPTILAADTSGNAIMHNALSTTTVAVTGDVQDIAWQTGTKNYASASPTGMVSFYHANGVLENNYSTALSVSAIAPWQDNTKMILGTFSGGISFIDRSDGLASAPVTASAFPILRIGLSKQHTTFYTLSTNGDISVWTTGGLLIMSPTIPAGMNATSVEFSSDGTLLVIGTDNGHALVYDSSADVLLRDIQIGDSAGDAGDEAVVTVTRSSPSSGQYAVMSNGQVADIEPAGGTIKGTFDLGLADPVSIACYDGYNLVVANSAGCINAYHNLAPYVTYISPDPTLLDSHFYSGVTIFYSETMNQTSLANSTYAAPAGEWSVQTMSNYIELMPSSNITSGTPFNITVNAGALDIWGHVTLAPTDINQTAAPDARSLQVISATPSGVVPQGSATAVINFTGELDMSTIDSSIAVAVDNVFLGSESFAVQVDNGTVANSSVSVVLNGTALGGSTIAVYANSTLLDIGAKAMSSPFIFSFEIDRGPAITFNNSVSFYSNGTIDVRADIDSPVIVAVANVDVEYPGGAVVRQNMTHTAGDSYIADFSPAGSGGTINITLHSEDEHGNYADAGPYSFMLLEDTTPPYIELDNYTTFLEMGSGLYVNATITDDAGIYRAVLDVTDPLGQTHIIDMMPGTAPAAWTSLIPPVDMGGLLGFNIEVTDRAGNYNESGGSVLFNDTTLPGYTHIPLLPGNTSTVFSFNVTATDNGAVSEVCVMYRVGGMNEVATSPLELTGGNYKNGSWTGTLGPIEQSLWLWYRISCVDSAGNLANDTTEYNITLADTTPPEVISFEPLPDIETGEPSELNITLYDVSGIEQVTLYYMHEDELYFSPISLLNIASNGSGLVYHASIPPFGSGVVYYYILLGDTLGHNITIPETGTLNATVHDMTPPEITFDPPKSAGTKDQVKLTAYINDKSGIILNVTLHYFNESDINGTVTDIDNITKLLDFENIFGSTTFTVTLPRYESNDTLHYYITASDIFGNTQRNPATLYYNLTINDTSPPVIELISGLDFKTSDDNFTIVANITDNVGLLAVTLYANYTDFSQEMDMVIDNQTGFYTAVLANSQVPYVLSFRIKAVDFHGNTGYYPSEYLEKHVQIVDDIKPTLAGHEVKETIFSEDTLTVNVTSNDNSELLKNIWIDVRLVYIDAMGQSHNASMDSVAYTSNYTYTIGAQHVGGTIQYAVYSIDMYGNTNRTPQAGMNTTTVIDNTPPAVPGYISATHIRIGNSSAILLTWQIGTEPDIDTVTLYRSENPTENFVPIALLDRSITEYTDINVTAGNTYYYKIRATDVYGNPSGLSQSGFATIPGVNSTTQSFTSEYSAAIIGVVAIVISLVALLMIMNDKKGKKVKKGTKKSGMAKKKKTAKPMPESKPKPKPESKTKPAPEPSDDNETKPATDAKKDAVASETGPKPEDASGPPAPADIEDAAKLPDEDGIPEVK